jgi:hypothetical protein
VVGVGVEVEVEVVVVVGVEVGVEVKSKRQRLHDRCWEKMSRIVRLKYADDNGYVRCYTCPTVKHWKEMHAGHFKHNRLDFDERNIRPQCPQCNQHGHGKLDIFADNLRTELGENEYAKLILASNNEKKMGEFELDLLKGVLHKQMKILEKRKL